MAVTADQYQRIINRLTRIEELLNDVLVANEQYITLGQMNQLKTVLETAVEDITIQVTALNDRVTAIEEEPIT